jgi:superfamily II DNA/RNA helicase
MSQSFADLGVSRQVAEALAKRGITKPFPVQRLVIEDVLDGHDVLVQSPTGSGKTFAFGVPMVDSLPDDARPGSALILAPTRELAAQIVDELDEVAAARGFRIAAVYGGVGFGPQIKRAQRAHIIVACPGRLEDLIDRRAINLDNVEILVLDEADRMLDMGFKPAVDRLVARTPEDRQTMFFSATLEGMAGKVARDYTYEPRRHVHAPEVERGAETTHRFVHLETNGDKLGALVGELRDSERGRTLVFVRTKRGADRLVKRLGGQDVTAVAMHGNKSQAQRQKALARFDRGDVDTLVATDVAARGIDVEDITHVINFDVPEDADVYTHRTGRTGRAGRSGEAVSFVLSDQSRDVRRIARDLGLTGEFEADYRGPAPRHSEGRRHNGGSPRENGNGQRQNGGGQRQNGGGHANGRRRRNRRRSASSRA